MICALPSAAYDACSVMPVEIDGGQTDITFREDRKGRNAQVTIRRYAIRKRDDCRRTGLVKPVASATRRAEA
jgi:hypothetical protein